MILKEGEALGELDFRNGMNRSWGEWGVETPQYDFYNFITHPIRFLHGGSCCDLLRCCYRQWAGWN